MSRTARLLDIMQILRVRRGPTSAETLAAETRVSPRTIYRDIVTLQAQGADISSAPGVGYVLRSSFTLPPLMFSREEMDALILGSKFVARNADPDLAAAANNALAKIESVLPQALQETASAYPFMVPPRETKPSEADVMKLLRAAMRQERKLAIGYYDRKGTRTFRTIWPITLAFFDQAQVCAAWCETRADFRHFRIDRIHAASVLDTRYPIRRAALVAQWREAEGVEI